jgi:hypothetical protein
MPAPAAIAATILKRRAASLAARYGVLAALAVLSIPLLLILLVVALFAGSPEATCRSQSAAGGIVVTPANPPAGLTPRQQQLFSVPLQMQPRRWYSAGATYYYAGDDTGSGTHGAIPDPAQSDLTQHPDTFAELSVLTENPANTGTFTFGDANALGALPWMTGLRVAYHGRSTIVYKRDLGFGQGSKTIAGERFRVDLWGPAAKALGTTSSLVKIQLAPKTGAGNLVGETPGAGQLGSAASPACPATGGGTGPLPLTPGDRAKLLPNGLAAAPRGAPDSVKRLIAAGNQLVGKPYLMGGGHGVPLALIAPFYDCSSAVSYLLWKAGLFPSDVAWVSGDLGNSYGAPGYGRWVSVLGNADHVYLYAAGLRFDTHLWSSSDRGVDGIGWHTQQRPDTGFHARHPTTLRGGRA